MTAPASSWVEVGDIRGPQGPAGTNGVSITSLSIDGSGSLLVQLSTGQTINAGVAKGDKGGGIDFESSVATYQDLPASGAKFGEARYVRSDGHLYVWEASADRGGNGNGWTDVGPIRGEQGPKGSDGAKGTDGVSVTGAAIDGNGHLILSLSSGSTLDAGVARGPQGNPGTNGTNGERGTDVIAYAAGSVPTAGSYRVGTIAIGGDGKILRAV